MGEEKAEKLLDKIILQSYLEFLNNFKVS